MGWRRAGLRALALPLVAGAAVSAAPPRPPRTASVRALGRGGVPERNAGGPDRHEARPTSETDSPLLSSPPPFRGQACAGVAGMLRALAALAVVGWAVVLALALDLVSRGVPAPPLSPTAC